MPEPPVDSASTPPEPIVWYSYAVLRLVPRVERGEFLNVGVILFARTAEYLAAMVDLDRERLALLAPDLDLAVVERHLAAFLAICAASSEAGPLATLPPSERFHWLTAPRSTIIQTSPVHVGRTTDLPGELERLLRCFVRRESDLRDSPDQFGGSGSR